MPDLTFVVAGAFDQIAGAYVYDRRVIAHLRDAGWRIDIVELPLENMGAHARAAFDALPDDAAICLEGLAIAEAADAIVDTAGRARVVALVHHPMALETGLDPDTIERYRAAELRVLRRCRGIICPSPVSAAAVADYGVDTARIAIVPPGIDLPPPRIAGSHRTGPTRLIAVGTVIPRKGHRELVEALSDISRADWHLTIVGSLDRDLDCAAALGDAISAAGLRQKVTLAGEWPPPRVVAAYQEYDIFALASWYEGYGMVFAEAMAYGLPIVTTTGGAIADTVPAAAGMLVPPGDRAALAAALQRLIGDAALRGRLGMSGRAHAEGLPRWTDCAERFGQALDRLSRLPPP